MSISDKLWEVVRGVRCRRILSLPGSFPRHNRAGYILWFDIKALSHRVVNRFVAIIIRDVVSAGGRRNYPVILAGQCFAMVIYWL